MQLKPKKSWLGRVPSQPVRPYANPSVLVAVVIMPVMLVISIAAVVVRPSSVVIRSVIWIPAVIAARVITVISRISVVAVAVCRVTDAESYWADAN